MLGGSRRGACGGEDGRGPAGDQLCAGVGPARGRRPPAAVANTPSESLAAVVPERGGLSLVPEILFVWDKRHGGVAVVQRGVGLRGAGRRSSWHGGGLLLLLFDEGGAVQSDAGRAGHSGHAVGAVCDVVGSGRVCAVAGVRRRDGVELVPGAPDAADDCAVFRGDGHERGRVRALDRG